MEETNDTGKPEAANVATPSGAAEGTPEQTLLAGKYKDVAELEKGYQEAQRKITELSQKPAEKAEEFDLRSLLEDSSEVQTPQYPYLDQSAIESMLKPVIREQKISRLENVIEKAQQDPKFKKYEGEVIAEIKSNPILFNEWKKGNPSVIGLAYKAVKAAHIDDEVTEAISRKSKELQSISQTAPKVEGDRSATPPPPKPRSVKGEIIDAIAEGREGSYIDNLLSSLEKNALKNR